MDYKSAIQTALTRATGEPDVTLTFPDRLEHGDYTTNVALILSPKKNIAPREYAQELVSLLENDQSLQGIVDKIDIAGPGFINFYLTPKAVFENIISIHKETDRYGYSNAMSGFKIMIEYTDPNPFKEFHIGHLYSNIVGETLARLFESQAATVKRACYQGDVGLHVAKSLYGMIARQSEIAGFEDKDLASRAKFLGECYVAGSKAYDESESMAQEIKELNKKVYQKDSDIYSLYQKGRSWSLEYLDAIYKRLGTTFDYNYYESEISEEAVHIVNSHIGKVFEESEGAVIFPGEKYGLHTRVFLNKQKLPTYEAKDLALPSKKQKDFDYDSSIIVTANEVSTYFKVVLKVLSLINPELAKKTRHIGHGLVKFSDRKISSRTGDVMTADQLLLEAKTTALSLFENMDKELAEVIALAAVRYALLKNSVGGDIEFSFEKSISLSGNSGPYLQYTYARTQSIYQKAKEKHIFENGEDLEKIELNEEEKGLMRFLSRYPEVLSAAQKNYSPSSLCTYLYELAQNFNTFYTLHKVVGSSQEQFRVNLTTAVGQVLKNGLYILGIQAPAHM